MTFDLIKIKLVHLLVHYALPSLLGNHSRPSGTHLAFAGR